MVSFKGTPGFIPTSPTCRTSNFDNQPISCSTFDLGKFPAAPASQGHLKSQETPKKPKIPRKKPGTYKKEDPPLIWETPEETYKIPERTSSYKSQEHVNELAGIALLATLSSVVPGHGPALQSVQSSPAAQSGKHRRVWVPGVLKKGLWGFPARLRLLVGFGSVQNRCLIAFRRCSGWVWVSMSPAKRSSLLAGDLKTDSPTFRSHVAWRRIYPKGNPKRMSHIDVVRECFGHAGEGPM